VAQFALLLVLLALLPFAGRLLHREDPLERADAIFVLAGERVVRWLEASVLLREGWAPRAVLSAGYQTAPERDLIKRGVVIASEAEVARSALLQMGHAADAIEVLPGFPDNTADEGRLLRAHVALRGWHSVIVVTSKLHTRRAGLAIEREMKGTGTKIIVRSTRYDDDEPARWWTKRRTIRAMLAELPKLIAYVLGLGP
jgi:uncharacterized SAM-binding protein YcdF (DUF218 family)